MICKKHIWLPLKYNILTEKKCSSIFSQIADTINTIQWKRNKQWPFLIKQALLSICVQCIVAQTVHMEFDRNNLSSIIKDLKGSSYVSSIPFPITLNRHIVVIPYTVAIKNGEQLLEISCTFNSGRTACPYSSFLNLFHNANTLIISLQNKL